MLSRIKKSLVTGLSVVLLVSLSCGMCVAVEEEPDVGCSRALVDGINDPCMTAETDCSLACYDALNGKVDTTPAFCGEHKIGTSPSFFLGCNEEFQKCMNKPSIGGEKLTAITDPNMLAIKLSRLIRRTSKHFWEEWKNSNRYWKTKHPKIHVVSAVAGALASDSLCVMYSGPLGPMFCLPLAMAYAYLFSVT